MTQFDRLSELLPDRTDEEIDELLELSKSVILNKRYPFGEQGKLEDRYLSLQIRIAVEIDAKSGAEGETEHTENGIKRVYSSANVSPDLINEVTPKGGVL